MSWWRRDRDSNPGWSCPHTGFRDQPIQPLWHLSSGGRRGVIDTCNLVEKVSFYPGTLRGQGRTKWPTEDPTPWNTENTGWGLS